MKKEKTLKQSRKEWRKPIIEEYDVAELVKQIIANADSYSPCFSPCSCSCATACPGIFGYSYYSFFLAGR